MISSGEFGRCEILGTRKNLEISRISVAGGKIPSLSALGHKYTWIEIRDDTQLAVIKSIVTGRTKAPHIPHGIIVRPRATALNAAVAPIPRNSSTNFQKSIAFLTLIAYWMMCATSPLLRTLRIWQVGSRILQSRGTFPFHHRQISVVCANWKHHS